MFTRGGTFGLLSISHILALALHTMFQILTDKAATRKLNLISKHQFSVGL